MTICSIEGCTKTKLKAKGLCHTHYERARLGLDKPVRPYMPLGVPSYNRAHTKLYEERGSAKDYLCVACGGPAEHWALKHDVDSLIDQWSAEKGKAYSLDPYAYQPMCVLHHFAYDREHGLRVDAR